MRDYNTSESSLTEMALWAQGMIVGSIIAFASTALLGCLGILVTQLFQVLWFQNEAQLSSGQEQVGYSIRLGTALIGLGGSLLLTFMPKIKICRLAERINNGSDVILIGSTGYP